MSTGAATAAGLLRKVKNPTTIGMIINITDRQMSAKPTGAGAVCAPVSIPFTLVLNGVPLAIMPPKMQDKRAKQRQHKETTTVIAILT